ncbi:MAG: O-antigen ligase family protein [Sedimenticola sp.]
MEYKYLILFIGVSVLVPVGIVIARSNPRALNLVFIALVFGTTQPDSLFGLPTDINFLSREWYRGSTRGIEISYLDLLALILFISSLSVRNREGVPFVKPPSLGFLKAYFIWALLTVLIVSEPKIFGVFELTKIFRAILVFLAVSAFMRSPDQVRLFVYILVVICFYEAAVALQQRYILGMHRIIGSLPHPNSLSMYSLQVFPITFSASFAPDISSRLRKLCLLASVSIAGVIILTISRTGFASLVVLSFLVIILNIRFQWTARNIGLVALVIVIGSLMVVKSWDSLNSRYASFEFENEYMSEEGDRGSYFRKGIPALEDNPIFGVGLNNWSYWISNRYAEKAGYDSETYPSIDFAPNSNRQQAPAHNLYLITAVELGVVGLVLLIALFGRWLYISGTKLVKVNGDLLDHVRLGLFLGLMGSLMQSVTEWGLRTTPHFFFAHIGMSVAAFIYYKKKGIIKN